MERYRKANEDIRAPEGLKRAAAATGPARRRSRWMGVTAAVLALAVLGGLLLWPGSPLAPTARAAVAEAKYPSSGGGEALRALRPDGDGLADFYGRTMTQYLSGGTENRVYSPLSVYMALAMLAEITGGDSREQILDLLGVEDTEELRALSSALWNANYRDEELVTTTLATSLWMRTDVPYRKDTLKTLAETYYASSFAGEMGSEKLNGALRNWVNEQTGGLLSDAAEQLELDPDAVLALVSTVYFRGRWMMNVENGPTTQETFYAPDGEVTADFMHRSESMTYYWGEHFTAIGRVFRAGGGVMWFILPDEGHTPGDLLNDPEAMTFLSDARARENWEKSADRQVDQSIPKFDVTAETDLISGLKALGVTGIFDERADFSPLLGEHEPMAVDKMDHAVRVSIDEAGCKAAAYTVVEPVPLSAPQAEEQVDFTLDRPFLFLVESSSGQALFAGVVNQP